LPYVVDGVGDEENLAATPERESVGKPDTMSEITTEKIAIYFGCNAGRRECRDGRSRARHVLLGD
jgi:hypothetical protein